MFTLTATWCGHKLYSESIKNVDGGYNVIKFLQERLDNRRIYLLISKIKVNIEYLLVDIKNENEKVVLKLIIKGGEGKVKKLIDCLKLSALAKLAHFYKIIYSGIFYALLANVCR